MHTFFDALDRARRIAPNKVGVICGDRKITYGDLFDRCSRLAGHLRGLGLAKGDRVAILSANSAQYIEAYMGVPAAGMAIVPLNTRHATAELKYALDDAGARVLLTDRDPGVLAESVETVIRLPDEYEAAVAAAEPAPLGDDVMEDDLAGLFYTGGTTGASKGVMLTHRNLIANTFNLLVLMGGDETDTYLVMAPLFHAAGSVAVISTIWTTGTQVIQPAFNPAEALQLVARHQATVTLGVPTMLAALSEQQTREGADLSSVRVLAHGGSPIATEQVRRAAEAFVNADLCHVYGATETAPLATGLRGEQTLLDSERARSCGLPMVGVQVQIRDADGNERPRGEVGEVAIRGNNVMAGYWNKPEQTAEVLRDGWYYSGDLGYQDAEGFIYLVDRAKDMIVSGGENVYSTEVEEALYKHPSVREAAVFGIPDDQWGEAVHAVVVPREPVGADELIDFCRQYIAGYKLPKSISFRDEELPKSGPGKILKRELRAPFWEGHTRGVN